jgi:hypothetical protein
MESRSTPERQLRAAPHVVAAAWDVGVGRGGDRGRRGEFLEYAFGFHLSCCRRDAVDKMAAQLLASQDVCFERQALPRAQPVTKCGGIFGS